MSFSCSLQWQSVIVSYSTKGSQFQNRLLHKNQNHCILEYLNNLIQILLINLFSNKGEEVEAVNEQYSWFTVTLIIIYLNCLSYYTWSILQSFLNSFKIETWHYNKQYFGNKINYFMLFVIQRTVMVIQVYRHLNILFHGRVKS